MLARVSAFLLLVAPLLIAAAAPNPQSGARLLKVDVDPSGEIALEARGVELEEVLDSIAAKRGFEVVMTRGIARPPVDIGIERAPLAEVLRQLMRGRNYALVFRSRDRRLSRLIVLSPPTAVTTSTVGRMPARAIRAGADTSGRR
jgi:hypothetical protein